MELIILLLCYCFNDIDISNVVARSSMRFCTALNEASWPRHCGDKLWLRQNRVRFTILFCVTTSMHAGWVDGDVSDHCGREI